MDPDLDPDPDIFVIDLQDANKKLTLKGSNTTVGIKVFLTRVFLLRRIRIRIRASD
jgi:hypothetical protein